jgi:transposase
MSQGRVSMHHIREVIRLTFSGLSQRQIGRSLGLSNGVIAKYQRAIRRADLQWPLPPEMDDQDLASHLRLPGSDSNNLIRVEPDFAHIHQQLKRKGVTRQLLWEEYCSSVTGQPYGYTQFCVRYQEWKTKLGVVMRQTHWAGEKLFVDYCGQTIDIVNGASGEFKTAQIFVAVLGASNYTYAEATHTQGLFDWLGAHTRAFTFFGGVPSLIVPDNLRSGVTKACRYEPQLNRSYAELLSYYRTTALPARPYKPRDKAKVEVGVQLVERWILARLRHQTFFSLFALNLAISKLLVDLNQRPFKKLPGTRQSQFQALDRPALSPLPAEPYEYAEWRKARVHLDYHIEIAGHYYSVPHSLIKREIDVRVTDRMIECFDRGTRVALHPRSEMRGAHSTQPEHMPHSHRAHHQWTPRRFVSWAASIGPGTQELVEHLLTNKPHPEQGYRSCLGLLSLAKRYDRMRLEAACRRALSLGSRTRSSVASILAHGLDQQPLTDPSTGKDESVFVLSDHANVRGPDYYQ